MLAVHKGSYVSENDKTNGFVALSIFITCFVGLILEYEPQAWFYTGLTISIIVLLILAATATIYYYKTSKTKPIP